MLEKRLIVFIFTLLGYSTLFAQYEQVWAFGQNAGIDFNSNPPQAITTGIWANEGCASISDVNGQLLFYTDGTIVWDRNQQVMPNGSDLTGFVDLTGNTSANITSSTSQGALIVPVPGSLHRYYVFSMGCWECNQLGRLSYSIIDMQLNNGLGDVVPDSNGILLDNTFTEHMTAVAGNNCDIWLITLSRENNGKFKAYNISVNGINTVPVVSSALAFILGSSGYDEIRGYMDISPNRKKLAIAKSNLILYDFNATTGALTDPVILIRQLAGCYGVAFSPDNTKLYVQDVKIDFNNHYGLQQFDLNSGDSLTIIDSRNTVHTYTANWSPNVLNGALKRAPDGKIYAAQREASISQASRYLGVIHQPNLYGTACNFEEDGFLLSPGSRSTYGLPNSTSAIFEHYIKNSSNNLICGHYELTARDTNGAGYIWDDGSSGPVRTVDSPGIYWVRYRAIGTQCVEEYTDSFNVRPETREAHTSITGSEACYGDTLSLSASYLSGTG